MCERERERETLCVCVYQGDIKTMCVCVWEGVPVSREEREMLFDDFCAAARWQRVYFLWRPNLPDASDDHVMDLAVACGVEHLVTHNVRDFQHGELHFSLPEVVTPLQHLEKNR